MVVTATFNPPGAFYQLVEAGFDRQISNKTLTDGEIDKTMTKLMGAFEQKMGALIRK